MSPRPFRHQPSKSLPGRPIFATGEAPIFSQMPETQDSILENGCWDEIKTDSNPSAYVSQMPSTQEGLLESGYWNKLPDWKPNLKISTNTRTTRWCIDLLRPSFLARTSGPRKQLHQTAYLDGLRGFAAFLVYWQHHQFWSREKIVADRIFENNFGYERKYYFACLPGIRIFFSGGHYAVCTFFVISGYVLSRKPLMLIQAGDYVKLGDNLASALFRRWLRLFIPVIATTFVYMTLWHAFGIWTDETKHEATYAAELWRYYCELKNFTFVFRMGGEPWFKYNFHTWSIPVEFKGSIVIYTSLLAFSRCTKNARLWCEVGLIYYFMYIVDGWYCSLFMAGMLICDLELLSANNQLPRFFSKIEPCKDIIFYHLLVISVYLGGVPSSNLDVNVLKESRGWYYLSYLKPQAVFDYKWFYLFWAATFLIACIPHIGWLKRFFETRFNQYLGRISYALYLVHGPILWIIGDRLYAATGWSRDSHVNGIPGWIDIFPLSKAGPLGFEMSFLVPQLILLPFTLWLADMVTRFVDTPAVKFAQWAYGKTLAPAPTKS